MRWYPDDAEVGILVLHGKNARTANVEDNGEERALSIREIAEDTIRYNPATGRIKVGANSVRDAKKLLALFAQHLIGDAAFFSGTLAEDLYTLDPLRDAGADFKVRHEWDPEVEKIVIREVLISDVSRPERGRSTWSLKASDERNALHRLRDLGVDLKTARVGIAAMKLDFHFRDGAEVVIVPVTLRPPNQASFQDHAYEAAIIEHLDRNGLRRVRFSSQTPLAAE